MKSEFRSVSLQISLLFYCDFFSRISFILKVDAYLMSEQIKPLNKYKTSIEFGLYLTFGILINVCFKRITELIRYGI